MRRVLIAIAFLAGGVATVALASEDGQMFPYDDPAVVAAGETLYSENCAICHGAELEGQPDWRDRDADGFLPAPPHDETGHTWHHADPLLFTITKYGTEAVVGGGYRSRMTGFGEILSDAEIIAVLAYIKSKWPARIIEMHGEINSNAFNQ